MLNKPAIEKFWAAVDKNDAATIKAAITADCQWATPLGTFKGPEQIYQWFLPLITAFAEMKHSITNCVDAGDRVAYEMVITGKFTGPLTMPGGAIPAHNKPCTFYVAQFAKFKDGKIADLRAYFDTAAFMAQLGVTPN